MVVKDDALYRMWYSGSDREDNEYHRIGYAESRDGLDWKRLPEPILVPPHTDGYYTTPSVLRDPHGNLLRRDGLYLMWFTGNNWMCDLHLATSPDGIDWDLHRPDPIARGVYCPTVILEGDMYKMWFTHQAPSSPMTMGYATSEDGLNWSFRPGPVLESTEDWEHPNLLYPFVLKSQDLYQMYYTSYGRGICEIALATSEDGIHWLKGKGPILSPDPASEWDSIYCSNPCIVPEPDGRDRLYYASRIDMKHKYFAIGLAVEELS
jgi:predicted GH43/DUF377 family glycosyl hydrolase